MNALFEWLTAALGAHAPLALTAALFWGIASVALSPCHLSSVPLAVAFLRRDDQKSALAISAALAAGVVASVALIGAITVAAGRIAGDLFGLGPWLLAAALLLGGLYLLGALELPTSLNIDQERIPKNTRGALLVGLFLGATLGPCTFAFFAPVFGAAFSTAKTGALLASALVAAFTIGHALSITVAGLLGLRLQGFLRRTGRASSVLRHSAGIALVAAGIYTIATAP